MSRLARYFVSRFIGRYIIALMLFGCSMELCARIDDKIKYGAPVFGYYSSDLLRETDSEGIRRNVPNSHFEKWKINELGFRGKSVPLVKAPGVIRIVCMGTSESFGLYEDPEMEWPAQLGTFLKDHGQFEVINASVVGMGLENFIPYLKKYVLHLDPDVVILYVNPYFYFESKMRKGNGAINPGPKSAPNKTSKKPKNELLDSLQLRSLPKIKQAVKQHVPQPALKRFQTWNMSRQVKRSEQRSRTGKNPLDAVPEEYLKDFEMDMKQLADFLKNHQAEVILSTYPSLLKEENLKEHKEIFLDFRRFCMGLSFKGMIDANKRFNEVLTTVAEKSRAGIVDNSRRVPKDIEHFGDNVHYTNKGAAEVARSFADLILSKTDRRAGFETNCVRGE